MSWIKNVLGALATLADVDMSGVQDGDVLTYTAATQTWGPAAPAGGAGGVYGDWEDHAIDDTLADADRDLVHTDYGASGDLVLDLPAAPADRDTFAFARVRDLGEMHVDGNGKTIRSGLGTAAVVIVNSTPHACCVVRYHAAADLWIVIAGEVRHPE